ncbi:MAG: hypothetical protein AB1750_02370 [Chloroflexota bacterium]
MKKQKQEPARRFESEVLALPPLKMVLVDAASIRREGERKTRALRKLAKSSPSRKTVEKLIAHLMRMDK